VSKGKGRVGKGDGELKRREKDSQRSLDFFFFWFGGLPSTFLNECATRKRCEADRDADFANRDQFFKLLTIRIEGMKTILLS
jgi:hypothetical protein